MSATTFLLIRHAAVDARGRGISGRRPGVHLSELGRQQTERLANRLARLPVVTILASPLERTMETAAAIGRALDLPVVASEALIELDFGEWTGFTLEQVKDDPRWAGFNAHRGRARIPGGEFMPDVQARVLAELNRLRQLHDGETVVLVSHGDVIRSALIACLGMPLDFLLRIELSTASISAVELGEDWLRVLRVNDTAHLEDLAAE